MTHALTWINVRSIAIKWMWHKGTQILTIINQQRAALILVNKMSSEKPHEKRDMRMKCIPLFLIALKTFILIIP